MVNGRDKSVEVLDEGLVFAIGWKVTVTSLGRGSWCTRDEEEHGMVYS